MTNDIPTGSWPNRDANTGQGWDASTAPSPRVERRIALTDRALDKLDHEAAGQPIKPVQQAEELAGIGNHEPSSRGQRSSTQG